MCTTTAGFSSVGKQILQLFVHEKQDTYQLNYKLPILLGSKKALATEIKEEAKDLSLSFLSNVIKLNVVFYSEF